MAAVYRFCEAKLATLNLPKYFTILELRRRLEQYRERSIHVIPREIPALGPHGLWVAGAHADYVFFDRAAGLVRQHQIIAHEFGHMLFDDHGTDADPEEITALLAPDVDPSRVQDLRRRTGYAQCAERRAEIFGTVALRRTHTWSSLGPRRPGGPPAALGCVQRL